MLPCLGGDVSVNGTGAGDSSEDGRVGNGRDMIPHDRAGYHLDRALSENEPELHLLAIRGPVNLILRNRPL